MLTLTPTATPAAKRAIWDRIDASLREAGLQSSSSVQPPETSPPPLPESEESPPHDPTAPEGHPLAKQARSQWIAHRLHHAARTTVIDALFNGPTDALQKRAHRMGLCCVAPHLRITAAGTPVPILGRCRDRLCPLCQDRRGRQAAARSIALVASMNAPRFITLTLLHSDAPLHQQLDRLYSSLASLRELKFWKKRVKGGIYGVEVTLNTSTKQWHAHVHVVADGQYMPHDGLKKAWLSITGDSFIVHIKAVPDRERAARYIARYVAKPADLARWSPAQIVEYAEAMHGRRLLQTFGSMHNRPVDDDEEPDHGTDYLADPARLTEADQAGDPEARSARLTLSRLGTDFNAALGVHKVAPPGWFDNPPDADAVAAAVATCRRLDPPAPVQPTTQQAAAPAERAAPPPPTLWPRSTTQT